MYVRGVIASKRVWRTKCIQCGAKSSQNTEYALSRDVSLVRNSEFLAECRERHLELCVR
jgi:hypothetical protein